MASASNVPVEATELRLVQNVELKFALADTEAKLQSLLDVYLCPLMRKLLSPHQSVRDKVGLQSLNCEAVT
jgi:proteasome component ECM29